MAEGRALNVAKSNRGFGPPSLVPVNGLALDATAAFPRMTYCGFTPAAMRRDGAIGVPSLNLRTGGITV